jgi:hypothetical protein
MPLLTNPDEKSRKELLVFWPGGVELFRGLAPS